MKICWQHVVNMLIEEKHKNMRKPDNGLDEWRFTEISYKEAKDFIEKYEWVGNMGTSKFPFALKFGQVIGSVVCFGPCVAPKKFSKIFGSNDAKKIIQLTRGATAYWAPKWCASKLISLSLRYLKKNTPFRIVIAYADVDAGEIGTVYQASNAFYIGMSNPGGSKKYIINGRVYDPRKVGAKFGSRAKDFVKKIDSKFKTIPLKSKHRYIFIIGNRKEKAEHFEKIRDLVLPYPKRNNRVSM